MTQPDDVPPGAHGWEYKLATMGNPLQPDVEERANAFGRQGWELAAIDAGVWIFKRPGPASTAAEPLQAMLEQTVPLAEAEPTVAVAPLRPGGPAARGQRP